jgi:hypothetical protein
MKTIIFTLLIFAGINSFARRGQSLEVGQLYYSAHCNQNCDAHIYLELYNSQEFQNLPEELLQNLNKVAFDQAQIWGDTILEGEYAADGNTVIDKIVIIKNGDRILGYAVTYSERAWYLGQCNYVPSHPESLQTCKEGRIQETSFVAANLRNAEVDQNQFAEFHSNE